LADFLETLSYCLLFYIIEDKFHEFDVVVTEICVHPESGRPPNSGMFASLDHGNLLSADFSCSVLA
jgi:hypothetical protein